MKYLLSLIVLFFALSQTIIAQQKGSGLLNKDDHYSSLWFSFTPSITYVSFDNSNKLTRDTHHVFSLGWLETTPVSSSSAPVMFEYGGIIDYMHMRRSNYSFDRILATKAPFNLLTCLGLTDSFCLYPYAGFNARLNIMGESVYQSKEDKSSSNLFNASPALKRFVFGYQVGLRARYNRSLFSISYESSITAFYSDNRKCNMTYFGIGYMF